MGVRCVGALHIERLHAKEATMASKPGHCGTPPTVTQYVTIRTAAKALGLKYHSILRAVNDGIIPSYRPFNSRRVVKLDEIERVIATFRVGGRHVG